MQMYGVSSHLMMMYNIPCCFDFDLKKNVRLHLTPRVFFFLGPPGGENFARSP